MRKNILSQARGLVLFGCFWIIPHTGFPQNYGDQPDLGRSRQYANESDSDRAQRLEMERRNAEYVRERDKRYNERRVRNRSKDQRSQMPFLYGIQKPNLQVYFVDLLDWYNRQSGVLVNELALNELIEQRKSDIVKMERQKFQSWVGEVTEIKAKPNGDAVLTVQVGKDLFLGNMSVSFRDSDYKSDIKKGTTLYSTLAKIKEGQIVVINGRLATGGEEKSHREEMVGSLPNSKIGVSRFIFIFDSIFPLSVPEGFGQRPQDFGEGSQLLR